jgi:hypothetical protein
MLKQLKAANGTRLQVFIGVIIIVDVNVVDVKLFMYIL